MAAAARRARLSMLRVYPDGGFEFHLMPDLAPAPVPPAREQAEAVGKVGSLESLRKRFGSATARQ